MQFPLARQSMELQHSLQLILDSPNHLVESDACALLLLNGHRFHVAASRGFPRPEELETLELDLTMQPALARLFEQGQPAVSGQALGNEALAGCGFTGLQACINAPLIYQGRPIGLLLLLKSEPDYYVEQHGRLAMAFAEQAAVAIENARLYAEARRQALQLEAASQAGQKVTSILEINEILAEVVRLIHLKLGYDHVNLFLVEGHSREIVLRDYSGQADQAGAMRGLRIKISGQSITGSVASSGQPLLANDVSQEPRYQPHDLLSGTRAELAVPLRVGDVVVGVLDVQSERVDAFRDDDVTSLQILADQVAIAIENARLFEETRHQYEAMHALHRISLDITSRLESDQVLGAILSKAAELLGAQGSTLAQYDPEIDRVRLIAVNNTPPEYKGTLLRLGEGSAGQAVVTGKPVIINDYKNWEGRSAVFISGPYDAVVSVPLRWHGMVFGALTVLDRGERRPFTDADVQLLSLFADLATIALKNAELHTAAMDLGRELEQKVVERTRELAAAREEVSRKADELQRLLRVTVGIQEEERTRIARDLHDGSNQLITGTLYELQAAQESLVRKRPEVALQKLEIAKGLLRRIEAENRRIISGLRPPVLDAQGLGPALKWYAGSFQKNYGIRCALEIVGKPARLTPEIETAVYRIAQEALNNVASHAQAEKVQIRVEFKPDKLRMVIVDNGIGIDFHNMLSETPGRMGLIGLRERAQSIGGTLEIQSVRGHGTSVSLVVPLAAEAQDESA